MFYPFTISANTIYNLRSEKGSLSESVDSEKDQRYIQLVKYLSATDGLIDGKSLKELWFPQGKYHIFLSHSHADVDLARYFKSWLQAKCDLKCFIDADVWDNKDSLLSELEKRFNPSAQRSKTLLLSTHVHSMLTMALFEAIDAIECPILIESSNSVTLKDGLDKGTLSPWIYEEVGFMGKLPHKVPSRYPTTKYFPIGTESVMLSEHVQDSIKIAHPLDTSNFKSIYSYNLVDLRNYYGTRALDYLYRKKNLLSRRTIY